MEISEVVDEPAEELVLYTVDDANAALVPGGVTKYEQEVDKIKEVYIANDKSAVTMVVTAQGYHEEPLIRLVVAMDPTGAIIGVKPVDFAETEGIGDRVGKPSYLDQYIGQTSEDGVDALGGATVSSNAVKKAIGKAVGAFELVKGGACCMSKQSNLKILLNGIIKENPVLVLILGTCPTLAVTSLAVNGLGMGRPLRWCCWVPIL